MRKLSVPEWCCAVRFNQDGGTSILNDTETEFTVIKDSYRYWTADPFLAEENGKYYFWGDMSGTSMSTPYVTGTLALWLEANPKLTYDDVIEVINETSTRDSFVKGGNQVQWGAGKINVYEGLKSVLRMNSGVGEVNSDKNMLMRNLGGNVYEMFVVGEPALVASVYDLSGRKVAETSADGDTVAVNLDGQQKGVYVVSVAGESTRYTKKVVVK